MHAVYHSSFMDIYNNYIIMYIYYIALCISSYIYINSNIYIYYIYILQSRKNAQIGAIEIARKRGMMAAYLNVTAITAALLVACFVTGMALGLYREEYARQKYLLDHAYNW